ncbi:MAG: virulence associated protein, partial [Myxococcaceae bacterium]|nr:virulence associated protein [Myxococcaceae bacterium]
MPTGRAPIVLAGLALAIPFAGCSLVANLDDHTVASDDAGPSGDAAPDTLDERAPSNCDETKDPRDEPCLVEDDRGVFASPEGDDSNPGTKKQPTRTITAAILKVGQRRNVFVCEGNYFETVALVGGGTGLVSLYGGFACGDWSYAESHTKPRVAPVAGLPLRVHMANTAIAIQDLAFVAPDATGNDQSSIAAIVNQSLKVEFARVQLIAGAGQNGFTPPVASGNAIGSSSLAGNAAIANGTGTNPGATKTCKCPLSGAGESSGGYGGSNTFGGAPGSSAPPPMVDPQNPNDNGAQGGATCDLTAKNGAPGLAGTAGSATTALGAITVDGWVPALGGGGGV